METVIIAGECRADELLGGFSIVKAREFSLIDCQNAAVILGRSSRAEIRSAFSVIVDGDEPPKGLPRFIQLISCGVSPKNTVSVTSRTPERLTLSLNRSVRTVRGVCEPLEYPVKAAPALSEYDIMAAFAARVLLEAENTFGE